METFKKVLKFSIEQKIDFLWLREDSLPVGSSNGTESEIQFFGSLSSDEINSVVKALLPAAVNIEQGETKFGVFPVVGIGDLQISVSQGKAKSIGLIINAHNSANKEIIDQKHKQNIFVEGALVAESAPEAENMNLEVTSVVEDPSLSGVTESEAESRSIEVNDNPSIDNNIAETDSSDSGFSIDMNFNLEYGADSSSSSSNGPEEIDGLGVNQNLSLDIDNMSVNSNDMDLSASVPPEPPSKAPEDNQVEANDMNIKLDEDVSDSIQIDGNFSVDVTDFANEAATSVGPIGDASLGALNSFPETDYQDYQNASELQYIDSYPDAESSQVRHAPKKLIFGAKIPGETLDNLGQTPIDPILKMMIEKRASDIHFTQGQPICLRIDGDIERVEATIVDEAKMQEWFLPIIPPKNKEELAETCDTDFAYEIEGLSRFRVNLFRDLHGIGAVIRQIPSEVLTARQLNLPDAIVKLCTLKKGLVLVTGPTGSGKSTTLAAMIDYINKSRKDHILTIEDPVEFVHASQKCLVNQREVYRHTTSFSRALKAALREDPDIVLIGEMRDLETVAIAIETAETGHLVFGTLHTNTAISTIDRLIDQFPSDGQEQIRVMLAESLKGVVSQTLLKKEGGGRVAAHEILIVDKAVGSQIREKNTHMLASHMQTQKKQGNKLLNDSLLELVVEGVVTPQEALSKAIDKDGLMSSFQIKKIRF